MNHQRIIDSGTAANLVVFGAYLIFAGITLVRHEPWGDELQGWNLLKGGATYIQLATEYLHEFHPYAWNTIAFAATKVSHSTALPRILHYILMSVAVWIFVFKSPFPVMIRVIILSGYLFIYEYAAFFRGYEMVLLFAFLICTELSRTPPRDRLLYPLLLLLSLTHPLAIFLSVSLIGSYAVSRPPGKLLSIAVYGFLCLLPALCLSLPATGNVHSHNIFSTQNLSQLPLSVQVPLRAFLPLPAWWEEHFWNSNAVLAAGKTSVTIKYLGYMLCAVFILLPLLCFGTARSRILFYVNLLACMAFALTFPLTSARYVGLVLLGFICAFWLSFNGAAPLPGRRRIAACILLLQIPGAVYALFLDWNRPFSAIAATKSLTERLPAKALAADFWAINYLVAEFDRPFYSVERRDYLNCITINRTNLAALQAPDRYSRGIEELMRRNSIDTVWLVSTSPPETILSTDTELGRRFSTILADSRTGALEKFSNLYVYMVSVK